MSDVPTILAILGGILLLLALLGGGLTVREFSVPTLPGRMRVILLPAGLVFIALGIWLSLPGSTQIALLGSSGGEQPAASTGASPAASNPTALSVEAPAEVPITTPVPAIAEWVDRFEEAGPLWSNGDDQGSTIEWGIDNGRTHGGSGSARVDYNFLEGGWGDCWVEDSARRDWSSGEGISFWLYNDNPNLRFGLWIQLGEVDHRSAFAASYTLPPGNDGNWTQVMLPWSAFTRADWGEPGGVMEFDPSIVVLYGFSFNVAAENGSQQGSLWIDDVGLYTR